MEAENQTLSHIINSSNNMHRQIDEMTTIFQNGLRYAVSPFLSAPNLIRRTVPFVAITVLSLQPGQQFRQQMLHDQIDMCMRFDDVWNPSFFKHILLLLPDEIADGDLSAICNNLTKRWSIETCITKRLQDFPQPVPSGPYFFQQGQIFKAFRIYDDVQGAFMLATRPRTNNSEPFQNFRMSGDFPPSLAVAVPSRLASLLPSAKPLQGMRFAIKDLFQLNGLRTTVGCRAYHAIAETSNYTAPCIQRLIDLGATLIGTLRLGSLITKEEPAEAADYGAPFNPRGDGYQSAWSSSGGSGAAIASYDWLDFTLATDTTGSSRRPALANGIFQLRVSHGALSDEGIVPSFRPFDSPSVFARDLEKIQLITSAWLDKQPREFQDMPIVIAQIQDFEVDDADQQSTINRFVTDLSTGLGAEVLNVSIADLWETTKPLAANGMEIAEYLDTTTGVNSFCYGLYHELSNFRATYHVKFQKEPYVNPTTRWRWDAAEKVSASEHEEAMNRLAVYKKWVSAQVLQTGTRHTLVVIPITTQKVDYRDDPAEPPSAPSAFQQLWLAPIMGAPEVSVPIGEIEYYSRVSRRIEYLPLVLSIMAEPGKDMELLDAALQTLKHANRPTTVRTGSRMFK